MQYLNINTYSINDDNSVAYVVPFILKVFGSRKPPHQTGSYMFYALEPNSKYEVVVQSKNKWGWSQTSKPFFFKTRATGKPNVITNLTKIFIIFMKSNVSLH